VKNSNFFVKGIFHLFFIKVHFKQIKQKAIERKGNISFFPFWKDIFFFSFFHLQTTDTLKVFFCWFFFLGVRYFFSFIIFTIFLAVFFNLEVFSIFFGIFFSGF